MAKAKKKLRKVVRELAHQIDRTYYDDYAAATNNHDKSYFNGMIDGLTFALMLLDKKAMPVLPQTLVPEYQQQALALFFEDDDLHVIREPAVEFDCA